MVRATARRLLGITVLGVAAATPSPAQRPASIAIPPVTGPLAIRVVYPAPTDRVDVWDSSFVFGTVGDGRARLTINGQPARVYPNGAFLAWIRYPERSPARLTLVATRETESVTATVEVARIPRFVPPASGPWIDTTSFFPRGDVWWPAGEVLPVSVRAALDARVELVLPSGRRVALAASGAPAPVPDAVRAFERDTSRLRLPKTGERYLGAVRGLRIGTPLGPVIPPKQPPAATGRRRPPPPRRAPAPSRLRVEAIRGRDTARAVWPIAITPLDSFPVAAVLDDSLAEPGSRDGMTVGRSHPGATYHWFFPAGTTAPVSGRIGDDLRLSLSPGAVAWVPLVDAHPAPGALAAGRAIVGSVTITPSADRLTVRVPVARRVPFEIAVDRAEVRVMLHGATADINWLRSGAADSLLESARWRQLPGDRVELVIGLSRVPWGHRARWDRGDLLLEIRRPPSIDPSRPLAGRLIAVDPGHPPAGSTGPTGLTEAEANLGVGRALAAMLEAAGARVLLTRDDPAPVELGARPRRAESAGADLLVSVHANAVPDGIDPFRNAGSSVFYFHPPSEPLARAVQARLVAALGTDDLGVARADLAVARATWMPAILTEGLFMMLPEHEATLRDPAGRRRYAGAVAAGIEDYLRALAR